MKPILFNTEMVKAILDGQKTVTRRIVKFKPGQNPAWSGYIPDGAVLYGSNNIPAVKAPFCPGDRLYVRETWGVYCRNWWEASSFEYRASFVPVETPFGRTDPPKWRPSIHMPKEAARIFLKVTNVHPERLQDITPEQAIKEGIRCVNLGDGEIGDAADIWQNTVYDGPVGAFAHLWDSTIRMPDISPWSWKENPWVFVIEFERSERPVDNG